MKALILGGILFVTSTFSGCPTQSVQEQPTADAPVAAATRQPVLVELFTSEGCSSCPPADRVLTVLQNDQLVPNADVITLGFHVDYWDDGGWKDRFSSIYYTRRQEAYARRLGIDSTYTPQMIVDGSNEFVGSNRAKANEVIAKSAVHPKASIYLRIDGGRLSIKVVGLPGHGDSTVYLAVSENGLSTSVGGGENAGTKLEHASVVRDLIPIGIIKGADTSVNLDHILPANADWQADNLKYVVFVQENNSLRILAVNQAGD